MRHLKVGHKLLAIAAGLAIPALVLLTLFLRQESRTISTTQKELTGVDYVPPVLAVIKDVQLHRRIASGMKNGSATQVELDRQSAVVASDLAALAEADQRLGLVTELAPQIKTLTDDWAALTKDLPTLTAIESSDRHSAIIAKDVEPMLGTIGAGTGLVLDPTRGGYFLQDLVLNRLPDLAERLGQARAYGLGFTGRDASQGAQLGVPLLANGIRGSEAGARATLDLARNSASVDLTTVNARATEAAAATTALLDLLTTRLVTEGVEATGYNAIATKAIDGQFETANAVADALRGELTTRLAHEKRSRLMALGAVLVVLLLGGGLALWVARRLTGAVHRLDVAYAQVRDGDLDVEVPVTSRDELGRLSEAFNSTVAELAAQRDRQSAQLSRAAQLEADVSQYTAMARRIAGGDLTARMDVQVGSELAELGNALNAMVDGLGSLSGEVRGASGELAGATTQILTVVRQHSSATSEQAASIAQTTVAVNEVRASAEQAAARAKEVAESALRAVEVAEEGTNAVDDIVSGIAVIRSRVETIAAQIAVLSTQTSQIDEITRSVSDIADQSNMLALNATIEAAKAGENGRGFAVVANEVRVLAEQSKAATAQVRELLAEIGRATAAAVEATDVGTRSAEIGVERARLAGNAIEQLSVVVRETASAADAIAAAAREQSVGMDEINRAISGVSAATSEIAGGANETESAASGLSTLAEYLGSLTNQFRVDRKGAGARPETFRDPRLQVLATELASAETIGDASATLARTLAGAFDADCAIVARFDADEAVPIGVVLPEGQRVRPFSLAGRTGLATVHRTGAPVRINDYRSLGEEGAARMARAGGYTNGVASPIRVGGIPWGGLLLATRNEEPLPIETEMFLANAAAIFADVLARPGMADAAARAGLAAV